MGFTYLRILLRAYGNIYVSPNCQMSQQKVKLSHLNDETEDKIKMFYLIVSAATSPQWDKQSYWAMSSRSI